MGIFNIFKKALGISEPKQQTAADPAKSLAAEETKKKKARQAALQSLNPTGTTGAGTPETTRRTTLGV